MIMWTRKERWNKKEIEKCQQNIQSFFIELIVFFNKVGLTIVQVMDMIEVFNIDFSCLLEQMNLFFCGEIILGLAPNFL